MIKRGVMISLMTMAMLTNSAWPGWASYDAGTDSVVYLGADARSVAMGSAGVVNTKQSSSMLWNPANLVYVPALNITVQHALLLENTHHDTIAVNYPSLDWGGIGLSLQRIETGDIDRRDQFNLPAGTFGYMEQATNLAYGYPVLPYLAAGLGIKIHHLRLDGYESMAPGVDIGILFNFPGHLKQLPQEDIFQGVQVGFSYRNAVTPVMELVSYKDQLFSNWRLGTGLTFCLFPEIRDRLQINADLEKPERANYRLHAGFDYQAYNRIALRGGWDHEYLSAGLGLRYQRYNLDYAISFPELGTRHQITLSASIGPSMHDLRARRQEIEEQKRQAIIDNLKNKMIEGYRQQAMTLTENGDYAAAVPLWEKVLAWDPDNQDVQQRLKLAQAAVQRKLNSDSLKLANDYYENERYIDAMVECRSVLERDPENIHANKLYQRSEKRAKSLGQHAMVTNVAKIRAIRSAYQKGLEAYTQRDWNQAINHWETVIENTPLQKQVYRYLRYARTRLADAKKSSAVAAKVSKKEKKKEKLYKEAVNKAKSGKLKDAMQTWEKLVKENPDDQDAKKNLEETKKNLIESQKKGIRW